MEKLTDVEVVKALELCATLDENNCKKCPCREVCNEVDGELTKMVLDLINRQDAEIINRTEEYNDMLEQRNKVEEALEVMTMDVNSLTSERDALQEMVKEQKAEIERLKAEIRNTDNALASLDRPLIEVKSEAYRECVERVKQVFGGNNIFETCVRLIVDSILNELTQNLHGTCTEGGNEDG